MYYSKVLDREGEGEGEGEGHRLPTYKAALFGAGHGEDVRYARLRGLQCYARDLKLQEKAPLVLKAMPPSSPIADLAAMMR